MAAVPESPPPAVIAEERYPVEFTASAGEYFRIWIVNLALTVLTLGIYSAWAKVRRKRYFYAHALLAGEGFEYRGNPVAILRGRIIAVGILVLYGALGHLSITLQVGVVLVFAIGFPWLLVRSLAFNAHNTAYRNIRFHFDGTYLDALKVLALCAAVVVLTLGLGYPWAQARLNRFIADHHRYGNAQASLPSLARTFYGIYIRLIGLILLVVILAVVAGMLIGWMVGMSGANGRAAGALTGVLMMPLGILAFYVFGFAYIRARFGNAIWNHLVIGGAVRFESGLRARHLAALYLVNILALVLTLGLATPWAVVRTLRYRARKTTVLVTGGLGQFVAERFAEVSAGGEEVGEMFGFDFSL